VSKFFYGSVVVGQSPIVCFYCGNTIVLYCSTVTISKNITDLLWQCSTIARRYPGNVLLYSCGMGAKPYKYSGTVTMSYPITVLLCLCPTQVLWQCPTIVKWCCGIVLL